MLDGNVLDCIKNYFSVRSLQVYPFTGRSQITSPWFCKIDLVALWFLFCRSGAGHFFDSFWIERYLGGLGEVMEDRIWINVQSLPTRLMVLTVEVNWDHIWGRCWNSNRVFNVSMLVHRRQGKSTWWYSLSEHLRVSEVFIHPGTTFESISPSHVRWLQPMEVLARPWILAV